MGVVKARELASALKRKGFTEDKKRDHYFYFLHYNGKKSAIYTKISHNESDIRSQLCSQIAKQMKLTSEQLIEFVDCALDAERYIKLLIAGKHLQL